MVLIFTKTSSRLSPEFVATFPAHKLDNSLYQVCQKTGIQIDKFVDTYCVSGDWETLVQSYKLLEELHKREATDDVKVPDIITVKDEPDDEVANSLEQKNGSSMQLRKGKQTARNKTTIPVAIKTETEDSASVDVELVDPKQSSNDVKYKCAALEKNGGKCITTQKEDVVSVDSSSDDDEDGKSENMASAKTRTLSCKGFLNDIGQQQEPVAFGISTTSAEADSDSVNVEDNELQKVLKDIKHEINEDDMGSYEVNVRKSKRKPKNVQFRDSIANFGRADDKSNIADQSDDEEFVISCEEDGDTTDEDVQPKKRKQTNDKSKCDIEYHNCDTCGYEAFSNRDLCRHVRNKHNTKVPCTSCGKQFTSTDDLEKHVKVVHKYQIFSCPVCKKSYKTKKCYQQHLLTHDKAMFSCQLCDSSFSEKENYHNHIKEEHLGKKKLQDCSTCGKRFSTKHYLKVHEKEHKYDESKENENFAGEDTEMSENFTGRDTDHSVKPANAKGDIPEPVVHCLKEHQMTGMDSDKATLEAKELLRKLVNKSQLKIQTTASTADDSFETEANEDSLEDDKSDGEAANAKVTNEIQDNSSEKSSMDTQNSASFDIGLTDSMGNKCKTAVSYDTNTDKEGRTEFHCKLCNFFAYSKTNLRRHVRGIHCRIYSCEHCGKTFGYVRNLNKHVKYVHGKPEHFCDICKRTYKEKHVYDRHMLTHQDDFVKERFGCEMCEKTFSTKYQLVRHVKAEHLGMQKVFECPICNKTTKSRTHYNTHMMVHSKLKPFVCDVCGKCFTYEKSLKEHKYMHENVRRFECNVCKKTFKQSTSLRTHLKTHTDKKDYICPICGKGFSQKQSLDRHERIHSGEKPFLCTLCSKTFTDSSIIRRHMILLHKRDPKDWRNGVVSRVKQKKSFYIEGVPEHHVSRSRVAQLRGSTDDADMYEDEDMDVGVNNKGQEGSSVQAGSSATVTGQQEGRGATVKDEPQSASQSQSSNQQPANKSEEAKMASHGLPLNYSIPSTSYASTKIGNAAATVGSSESHVGPPVSTGAVNMYGAAGLPLGSLPPGFTPPSSVSGTGGSQSQPWEFSGFTGYYPYQNYQQFQGPQN